MFIRRLLLVLALIVGTGPAFAESAEADPPARVGRLSHIEGTVSYHRANEDQWSAAKRNYPVTTGDAVWTEPGAKAEIQVGPMALRMDQSTEIDVARLDDSVSEFALRQGTVAVTLRAVPKDGVRILTPRGEVVLWRKGSYRIDAGEPAENGPADPLQVTVLDGFARVHGPKGAIELHRGESATIEGDPADYAVGEAAPAPIDNWALARERRMAARAARRYVPEEMTGSEDLDAYGRWDSDPAYGPVWYPVAVPVGWAPYRYGHWAYVAPWGWTWIDDAPWGFAPFHYGRWALIGGVWGWCPGTFAAHPVYAPALVAFVGGSNWGLSLSIGAAVGWLPLAPFEVYRPYYPASVTYVKNVNITNVNTTVINTINRGGGHGPHDAGHYRHHRYATVMGEHDFAHGRNAHDAALRVPQGRLAHAPAATRLDHLRPAADGREASRGPAFRSAEGRDDRRGQNGHRDGRFDPRADGTPGRVARIEPQAGQRDGRTRDGQPPASNDNAQGEARETRDGAPGPRLRSRDGHGDGTARGQRPEGSAARPSAAPDSVQPGTDSRMSRAPGSPVMRRDDARRAQPNDPRPAPDSARPNAAASPWPNGHRSVEGERQQRTSNAAPGPEIQRRGSSDNARTFPFGRPAPSGSGGTGEPQTGAPSSSAPAPGPRSTHEDPFARATPSGPGPGQLPRGGAARERMPERTMPQAGPEMRRPERQPQAEQPFMRPAPQTNLPPSRPQPQAMPREMAPPAVPNASPRMAPPQAPSMPPVARSAPPSMGHAPMPTPQAPQGAPVMRAPQASAAPQAAPSPPQMPQGAQGPQGSGERRRHGGAP